MRVLGDSKTRSGSCCSLRSGMFSIYSASLGVRWGVMSGLLSLLFSRKGFRHSMLLYTGNFRFHGYFPRIDVSCRAAIRTLIGDGVLMDCTFCYRYWWYHVAERANNALARPVSLPLLRRPYQDVHLRFWEFGYRQLCIRIADRIMGYGKARAYLQELK